MRNSDTIEEIGIDEGGRLYLVPSRANFPLIYREAMEVHWNPDRRCLYGPKPREWSYLNWYRQITAAAREQGYDLQIIGETRWVNIDADLQAEILGATA